MQQIFYDFKKILQKALTKQEKYGILLLRNAIEMEWVTGAHKIFVSNIAKRNRKEKKYELEKGSSRGS